MSRWVRSENNVVREVIPESATIPNIAHWYGEEFAAECVEAPDEVDQRWVYNPDAGTFSEPTPETTLPTDPIAERISEIEDGLLEIAAILGGDA